MLAEVVGVGAVDDHGATGVGHLAEPGPQLRLAEVAPVRRVAQVLRVVELAGVELEQRHLKSGGQLPRGAPLRFGIRGAAPDHGEKAFPAERLGRGHREQCRIHAPGVPEDDTAETAQVPSQKFEVRHGGET